MIRALALALCLLAAPAVGAEEDYLAHGPCRGVVYQGAFKTLACSVELEAGSSFVFYFKFDAPVTQLPLITVTRGGNAPAYGVTATVVALYPTDPAKAHNVKVLVTNYTDAEVYVTVGAWVGR